MKYKVCLNDRVYVVEVERGTAMLADEYAAGAPAAPAAVPTIPAAASAPAAPAADASAGLAAGEVVKSPMPGNILRIDVCLGQKVSEGDVLLRLEAMKMENEVVATKTGVVAQIAVAKGAVVETGDPLVVIA